MKESKLSQTDVVPKSTHHTFRNMMLLILFALAIWSWFNYLPQHAIDTLAVLNDRAYIQINKWLWVEVSQPLDYSLMLPTQVVAPAITSGEVMSGDTNTGDSQISGWSNIVTIGRSADSQTWAAVSGDINTGTTIWDEVDANNANNTVVPSETNTTTMPASPSSSAMSITVGWQTITVDGTLDEDIIINGNGYTITVEQN